MAAAVLQSVLTSQLKSYILTLKEFLSKETEIPALIDAARLDKRGDFHAFPRDESLCRYDMAV